MASILHGRLFSGKYMTLAIQELKINQDFVLHLDATGGG